MTYIATHHIEIDRSKLSDMLQEDNGAAKLEIKLHYSKDSRPRGLKLGVYRVLHTDFGCSYDIMNSHNKTIHIADFDRKPSAKIAAQWAALVSSRVDAIAEIALASDSPDWSAIKALFAEVAA